ncbi:sensor histidine kinase [Laspinema olomoucense]|uniref:sensor histidine kinase n=1 Tax=Laspinema olomoucense TaxID=3231600 RepID=UPI0021BB8952|nr:MULTISPECIES: HAMP domain-containing histidine kinase [unclassified Laspinema]MCT7975514.1 HAMP domain-containing histidine kinase [Laspinema sp. D3d]MCT7991483.1 HAMP domain-containing histidine kinase [Laspinema sp. D3a]
MQLQEPYEVLETRQQRAILDPPPIGSVGKSAPNFVDKLTTNIRRLSIKQKIGYGYALTISIALLGTGLGLVVGDRYHNKAKQQLVHAYEQQRILTHLQYEVITARSYQQGLVSGAEESLWNESKSRSFLAQSQKVKRLLTHLQVLVQTNDNSLLTVDESQIQKLWKIQQIAEKSSQDLIQLPTLNPNFVSGSVTRLTDSERPSVLAQISRVEVALEALYQELDQTLDAAQAQETAAKETFTKAESLRWKIAVLSMILSVAIAAMLASYTSQAIARPIEWVTQVALRTTEQSNYRLRAPILTEDEAGLLATSLNQLISRVEEQLQEIQQAQTQLIQTEKMSSLGQLVAGIAHEINNPINFITGNIEHSNHYIQDILEIVKLYQKEHPNPSPELQELIEDVDLEFVIADLNKMLSSMSMGSERIRQIVLSLRNFSRLDESEKKRVDIHEGIDSTLLLCNHRLQPHIEVITRYDELEPIECYPAQLNQVFMHLISNAIDALESKQPKDSTALQSPRQILIQTQKLNERTIQVKIADNGAGMDEAIRSKIFDPFYTTKPPGKGTGLGLSIVYRVVEKHGGKIEVSSQPGRGTEFRITLPLEPLAHPLSIPHTRPSVPILNAI